MTENFILGNTVIDVRKYDLFKKTFVKQMIILSLLVLICSCATNFICFTRGFHKKHSYNNLVLKQLFVFYDNILIIHNVKNLEVYPSNKLHLSNFDK